MSSDALIGRVRELEHLTKAVSSAANRGSVLLLVGEPGIGKSALMSEAQRDGRGRGYSVFNAVGVEGEMHLPFGAIQQLLSPLLDRRASLPFGQRDAIETAFGLAEGPAPDIFLIAEAALALFELARSVSPVIIAVDDLQWLDAQSHQILTFLGHRAKAAKLFLLAAIRANHPGLFTAAGFEELVVTGVDDATAGALLLEHAPELNALARNRIRAEAEGNPLALLELPRAWADGAPANNRPAPLTLRLERAFAGRVSELPSATRDALLVAAIESSSDTDEILAALAALGALEPSPDVFRPAVDAGLIRDVSATVEFLHPLVRSGVLQSESVTRQHAAHLALAHVITGDPYRSIWHRAWSIIGPDDAIADLLAGTVPSSLRRGAAMAAVSGLERAAQLTSTSVGRGERLVQAALIAFGAGLADVVGNILLELEHVDLNDLDRARVTWIREALNGDVSSSPDTDRELCRAAEVASVSGDSGLALNLLMSAGVRCWWAESPDDGRSRVIRILDELVTAQDDPRHIAAVALTEPVLRGSEVSTSLRRVELERVTDGDFLRTYAMAAYAIGDLPLATDLFDRAEQLFRDQGRLGPLTVVLALQLHIRLELGDWAGAAAASEEVYSVSLETGQEVYADNNVFVEARGAALRGEWEIALDKIVNAERDASRLKINDRVCLAYQTHGTALLSGGRAEEAFVWLAREFDPQDVGYHLRESFSSLSLLAEAALNCGRVDEARDILLSMEATAVVTPSPLLHVNLLYARAALAPHSERGEQYREALQHNLTRWPWLRARLQLEYGRWLISGNCNAEGRTQLLAALDVFDLIGATRWSYLATQALQSLGPTP